MSATSQVPVSDHHLFGATGLREVPPVPAPTLYPAEMSAGRIRREFAGSAQQLFRTLEAAGCSSADIVRAEVALSVPGAGAYSALQQAYLETFPEPRPARVVTGVHPFADVGAVRVGAAVASTGGAKFRDVVAPDGPAPCAPFPHARICEGLAFVTAQVGSHPMTGSLAPVEGGFGPQLAHAILNLVAILRACGSDVESLVETRVQYTDPADGAELHQIIEERIGSGPIGLSVSLVPFVPTAQAGICVKIDAVASVAR